MLLDILSAKETPFVRFNMHKSEPADSWADPLEYKFAIPVDVKAEYWYDGHALQMAGHISTKLAVPCSKCLEEVVYPVELDFTGVFRAKPDEEAGEYPLLGEEVLLDKCVLDEILLSLPSRFLCKPNCKGICPVCGVNKNYKACECEVSSIESGPFEKLKDLFQ